ncbi:MAG TPA: flagellar basal body-associated FliL family protein [Brevundimonas sp.]|jgi:flagellar FliL protein|uniref:flagellar basal body-associated FliL family protein n=1 Tax=Brevundimonas sp. TaxID=1871086 RepID=UPI002CBB302C|nr:flagellar basal body-associated FliL family protein [Brevundimonas sp.]HRH19588.1 flagellar basal body-associated FliL family protein [Brevundimonas sp.]
MFKFGKKKKDAEATETGTEVAVAAEGAEGAEGEAAPKKKKLPLFVLIGAAAVLVLGGGGAAVFFLFMQPSSAEEVPADHAPEEKKESGGGGHGGGGEEAADPAVVGTIREGPDGVTFLTLPDMVVNIQSADGRPTFLKLTLTLEMHDAELAHHLQAESPRVNDLLQTFLRELRPEDLAGSAGSYQLRQEILRRVNLVAAPEEVDAVLIEEMLIQ